MCHDMYVLSPGWIGKCTHTHTSHYLDAKYRKKKQKTEVKARSLLLVAKDKQLRLNWQPWIVWRHSCEWDRSFVYKFAPADFEGVWWVALSQKKYQHPSFTWQFLFELTFIWQWRKSIVAPLIFHQTKVQTNRWWGFVWELSSRLVEALLCYIKMFHLSSKKPLQFTSVLSCRSLSGERCKKSSNNRK